MEGMSEESLALAIDKYSGDDPHVTYERLSVSSETPCHCGEEVKYLLHDSQTASNMFKTSKWNAASSGQVTITIEVNDEPI